MPIRAVWKIKAGGVVHEPGAIVTGLSSAEERDLIALGAATTVNGVEEATVGTDQITALRNVLKPLTKKELLAYAERAQLQNINDKMKNDEILSAIVIDAEKQGIDLEAFTDDQMKKFTEYIGIQVEAEMTREQMLDAIESHFGG